VRQIDIDLENDQLSTSDAIGRSFSQNEIDIESNDSQYSDSNEGKHRKIKRKRISKKYAARKETKSQLKCESMNIKSRLL